MTEIDEPSYCRGTVARLLLAGLFTVLTVVTPAVPRRPPGLRLTQRRGWLNRDHH